MKFTPVAIAALTLASSQSLAAPMPREAPESANNEQASLLDLDLELEVGLLKKKRSDGQLGKEHGVSGGRSAPVRKSSIIQEAEPEHQTRPRATGTDAIRRGIPLTPDSVHTNIRQRRQAAPAGAAPPAAKPSPGLVGSLGLAGALGGLGLGGLLPGVESAVGGIPIVGAPVAGIVTGADNAVGVTALLSPKDDPTANATVSASTDSTSASASANVKRQDASANDGGLIGTLGLDGALSALGLGGLLGTVENTVNGLPVVGPVVGGLLGSVDGAVGLSALLGGGASGPSASASAGAAKRDVSSAAATEPTVPLSTLLGLIGQLQQAAGDKTANTSVAQVSGQAEGAATSALKPAAGAISSSPLGGLSIAQAEALGLLPAGFANSLLVNLKQKAAASVQAAGTNQGNLFLAKGGHQLSEEQDPAAFSATSSDASATATATATSATDEPTASSTFSIAPASAVESAMVNQAEVKAAAAASPTLSTSATVDSDEEDEDASEDDFSDDSDDDEAVSTLLTGTTTAAAQPTASNAAAMRARRAEAETDASAAPATFTAMSSSTMAPTPSQAQATASAMSLEPSEEGETAAPTSAPALRAKSLD